MAITYSLPLLFFVLLPAGMLAQAGVDEDPFRRDPFFTKPIHEFFQVLPDSAGEDRGMENGLRDEEIRRYIRSLNEDGIDMQGGLEAGPYHSNPLFSQFPNLPMIRYNRVNGLFMGIKRERMQWHDYNSLLSISTIRPHGFIGYGTASREWEYAIGAEKMFGERGYFMIGGEYHRAASTDDYWRVGLIESGITSFFASYDFPDYYKMEGFGVYMAIRSRRLFEGAISFNFDEFSTLETNTGFSVFGGGRNFRPNRPIDPSTDVTDIRRVNAGLAFNPRRLVLFEHVTFSASLRAELAGNSSYGNEFSYNRYLGEWIAYHNVEPGTLLKWRLRTGAVTGEAPAFRQFQLGGVGTLRGTPYKLLEGNQMVLSNLEAHFGSRNSRTGDWVNLNDFHFILFLDSGWVRFQEKLTDGSNPFTGLNRMRFVDMTHDAGIGLGSGLLRFELGWPLNSDHRAPTFWVRFNPTF